MKRLRKFTQVFVILIGALIIRLLLIILLIVAGFVLLFCAILSIKLFDYALYQIHDSLTKRFVKPVLVIFNGI